MTGLLLAGIGVSIAPTARRGTFSLRAHLACHERRRRREELPSRRRQDGDVSHRGGVRPLHRAEERHWHSLDKPARQLLPSASRFDT